MSTRPSGFPDAKVVVGDGHEQPGRLLLYIEDNQSNLTLVRWVLERDAGTELIWAMHGRGGLELARERQPDLIVLDLHLPDVPGETVLQCLKADITTRRIPVVVLSADTSEKKIKRLLRLGAHDYMTKPLDIAHFLKMISENLQPHT